MRCLPFFLSSRCSKNAKALRFLAQAVFFLYFRGRKGEEIRLKDDTGRRGGETENQEKKKLRCHKRELWSENVLGPTSSSVLRSFRFYTR